MAQGIFEAQEIQFCDCFSVNSVCRATLDTKKGPAPSGSRPSKTKQYIRKTPLLFISKGVLAGADDENRTREPHPYQLAQEARQRRSSDTKLYYVQARKFVMKAN